MAETSALEEDLSQRLYFWVIGSSSKLLVGWFVLSSHGFSSFFVRLTGESVGLALHSVMGGSLVVFILDALSHAIFIFLSHPKRLDS
jgi:hypothetical protein